MPLEAKSILLTLISTTIISSGEPTPKPVKVVTGDKIEETKTPSTPLLDQEKTSTDLNIKFMLRGYFNAYSKNIKGIGGHARSKNFPVKISAPKKFPKNTIFITLNKKTKKAFANKYTAVEVIVGNSTQEMVFFSASDSRLGMVHQAKNSDGKWKNIEYLSSSFCGNSHHSVGLEPGHMWSFSAPVYHGNIKTKLRIALSYGNKQIYSEEFDGSINKEQFTVKKGYNRENLMSP